MNIYVHQNSVTETNSYVLGSDGPGPAIIVDPGSIDVHLIDHIERNRYQPTHILVTRPRPFHVDGIRTLKRIYNLTIVAPCRSLFSFGCREAGDPEPPEIAGFDVRIVRLTPYTQDAVLYLVEGVLFTGDVMGAGVLDVSASSYGRELLVQTIRDEVFSLPSETVILPSIGPPSTVQIEIAANLDCHSGGETVGP